MPFQPFEFDESVGQTEPGRPHVPEGYYLLTKVRMEPTPEDYAKTTGVYTTLKFKEAPAHAQGAGVGREIREYSSLGGAKNKDGRGSQFGFGLLLGALGFAAFAKKLAGTKMESYAEFKSLIETLDARTGTPDVVALIADEPGNNGRPFSSIVEFLPAAEWPTLRGTGNLNLTPAPRPTVANGTPPSPAATEELKSKAMALFDQ